MFFQNATSPTNETEHTYFYAAMHIKQCLSDVWCWVHCAVHALNMRSRNHIYRPFHIKFDSPKRDGIGQRQYMAQTDKARYNTMKCELAKDYANQCINVHYLFGIAGKVWDSAPNPPNQFAALFSKLVPLGRESLIMQCLIDGSCTTTAVCIFFIMPPTCSRTKKKT